MSLNNKTIQNAKNNNWCLSKVALTIVDHRKATDLNKKKYYLKNFFILFAKHFMKDIFTRNYGAKLDFLQVSSFTICKSLKKL